MVDALALQPNFVTGLHGLLVQSTMSDTVQLKAVRLRRWFMTEHLQLITMISIDFDENFITSNGNALSPHVDDERRVYDGWGMDRPRLS